MKKFSIYCKNKKEANRVLKRLEEQGYLWQTGDKPTKWYPPLFDDREFYIENASEIDMRICYDSTGTIKDKITANEFLGNNKIIIYTRGKQVIAKNTATEKEAIAKCSPDDEFDFSIGARLAFDRLMEVEKPITVRQKRYNGKIVCIKERSDFTTKGKIYEVKNGRFYYDNGYITSSAFTSVDHINADCESQFIEIVE